MARAKTSKGRRASDKLAFRPFRLASSIGLKPIRSLRLYSPDSVARGNRSGEMVSRKRETPANIDEPPLS